VSEEKYIPCATALQIRTDSIPPQILRTFILLSRWRSEERLPDSVEERGGAMHAFGTLALTSQRPIARLHVMNELNTALGVHKQ
jgi:hypothetical protein